MLQRLSVLLEYIYAMINNMISLHVIFLRTVYVEETPTKVNARCTID